jgi:hypothetical protein
MKAVNGPLGRFVGNPEWAWSTEQEFWLLAEKTESCWLWKGYRNEDGYGATYAQVNGKRVHKKAHQVAFFFSRGHWPKYLMHSCDNPACVNPEHLREGTHTENVRDAYAKGRKKPNTKTHCLRGHPLSGDNLYMWRGRKNCRECIKLHGQKRSR